MSSTETRAPGRGRPLSQRGGPRPGIATYGPRHRWPALSDKAVGACFGVVLLILLGVGVGLARAQEAEEPARYTPSSRSGRQAVQELAEAHFAPEWVGWAVRVARCESGFDLFAESSGWDPRYGWYRHVGAMQVSAPTWGRLAWEMFGGPLTDPNVNFAMAAWILEHQGPNAWPVCRWAR